MGTRLGLLLAAVLASGCATTLEAVIRSKSEGKAVTYPIPKALAFVTAQSVLYECAQTNVDLYRSEGWMTVTAGSSTDTTFIVVWVDPGETAGESVVTAICRKKSGAQLRTMMTDQGFHDRFAAALRERKKRRGEVEPEPEPEAAEGAK